MLSMDVWCLWMFEACATRAMREVVEGFMKWCGEVMEVNGGGYYVMVKLLFGLRVLESVMGVMMEKYLRMEGVNEADEARTDVFWRDVLEFMGCVLVENVVDVVFDKCVSFVVWKFLVLFVGRVDLNASGGGGGGARSDGKSLVDKLCGGMFVVGKFFSLYNVLYRFNEELRKFFDVMLVVIEEELWNLVEDTCGSALL